MTGHINQNGTDQSKSPRKSSRGHRLLICSAVAMTMASLFTVGCEKQPVAAVGALPVEVAVTSVEPATVPVNYEFIGQTSPSQTVEIRARIQGFLLKRSFTEGELVKKGADLYSIDPQEFQANLEAYKAKLANAQAQAVRWKRDVDRLTPMLKQGSASQKEVDDSQSLLDSFTAEARQHKAAIARAQLDLDYTSIKSPLTGRVARSEKDEGSLVDAGANSMLTTVTQVDPMSVYFTISEREVLALQEDRKSGKLVIPERGEIKVGLTMLDGSKYDKEGQIDFADVKVDPNTGTAALRAQIANPPDDRGNEKLRPGQFLKVQLTGAQRVNAVMVPQRAVLQSPAGSFVFVVGGENKVEQRRVKVGPLQASSWIIDEGLKKGDQVIVDGVQRVQPGLTVKIVQAAADPKAPPTTSATPVAAASAAAAKTEKAAASDEAPKSE